MARHLSSWEHMITRHLSSREPMMTRYMSSWEHMMKRHRSSREHMMTRHLSSWEHMMRRHLSSWDHMMTWHLSSREHMMTRYMSSREPMMTQYMSSCEHMMTRHLPKSPLPPNTATHRQLLNIWQVNVTYTWRRHKVWSVECRDPSQPHHSYVTTRRSYYRALYITPVIYYLYIYINIYICNHVVFILRHSTLVNSMHLAYLYYTLLNGMYLTCLHSFKWHEICVPLWGLWSVVSPQLVVYDRSSTTWAGKPGGSDTRS